MKRYILGNPVTYSIEHLADVSKDTSVRDKK